MTIKELDLFTSCLKTCCNYLEFGSGDSTIKALSFQNIRRIVSVESDIAFASGRFNVLAEIRTGLAENRLKILHADIGKTRNWGTPVDTQKKHLWPFYASAPFGNDEFDLVLVDGRFRVACALQSLIHCGRQVKVLVHDYFQRPQYHILERFFDISQSADGLVLLVPKAVVDWPLLNRVLKKYSYLPEDKTLWFRLTHRLPRIFWEKLISAFG